jgi:hypothetical protein
MKVLGYVQESKQNEILDHIEIILHEMSNSSYYLAVGLVIILALIYRLALHKPYLGISHNQDAARSILGDLPSLIRWKKATRSKDMSLWISPQLQQLDSPIGQVFISPFKRPTIIVKNAQATQDALAKIKVFDRSRQVKKWLAMTTPNSLIGHSTGDEWRVKK